MSEALNVQLRSTTGKRNNRRLRRAGQIPAVLYGHGQPNVNLAVSHHDVAAVVRHGSRVVDLQGAATESALIRDLQWDTFGMEILHVDFARVSADERIEIEVQVELKGTAAGVRDGGIIEHFVHSLRIECPALRIPDKIVVNVSGLNIDDALTAGQVPLPDGVTLLSDADAMVVHCVRPVEAEEEPAAAAGPAEPEVIGRKPAESEEGEEES